MADPLVVRVAFLSPIARGSVIELTYFAKIGILGEVVFDEEPVIVDRSTGVVYSSDRFSTANQALPELAELTDGLGFREVRKLSGTVVRSVVVSSVLSNAPLRTEITLIPIVASSPYR